MWQLFNTTAHVVNNTPSRRMEDICQGKEKVTEKPPSTFHFTSQGQKKGWPAPLEGRRATRTYSTSYPLGSTCSFKAKTWNCSWPDQIHGREAESRTWHMLNTNLMPWSWWPSDKRLPLLTTLSTFTSKERGCDQRSYGRPEALALQASRRSYE